MPPSLAAFFFGEEENQVSSVVAVRRIRATSYSLLATGRLRHLTLSNESFARIMEHRAGIEPANTGFADQRVSHFATGALDPPSRYGG
jgi:hypothetical protein